MNPDDATRSAAPEHELLLETVQHGRIAGEFWPDDLERDHTVHFAISRLIDRAHSTASQNLENFITLP